MADYLTVQGPSPASYGAGNIGQWLAQTISNLPQQYFQGTQQNRTLQMQKPIIDPATGQPSTDIGNIQSELQRRGGAEYSEKLLPFLYGQQAAQSGSSHLAELSPNAPATANPNAAGPANLQPQSQYRPPAQQQQPPQQGQQQPAQQQPGMSSTGMDNQGADTILGMVTGYTKDPNVAPQIIGALARQYGVSSTAPLPPQVAAQIDNDLKRIAMPSQGQQQGGQLQPGQQTPQPGQQGQSAAQGQPSQVQQPPGAVGTPPFAPSPQQSPQQPQGQQPQQAPPPSAPPNADYNETVARRYEMAAEKAQQYAVANAAFNPKVAEQAAKQAEAWNNTAKQIREGSTKLAAQAQEGVLKSQEPTEMQKNLVTGASAHTEEQKNEIAQSQKTYNGMQAQATQYQRELKPALDISRSVLDDPQMYSGMGADAVLDFNRLRAVYGDQRAALLQEAFKKVTAISVLGQINGQKDQLQEAGGTSSRIFQQQVELVQQAAPQLANTLAGNRFLVEVSSRLGEQAVTVAGMARDYIGKHGHLDSAFDGHVARYLLDHPIMTKDEASNVSLIAPPLARTPEDLKRMNWQPGTPVRVPTDSTVAKSAEAAGNPGIKRADGTTVLTHFGQPAPQGAPQQPAAPGPQSALPPQGNLAYAGLAPDGNHYFHDPSRPGKFMRVVARIPQGAAA